MRDLTRKLACGARRPHDPDSRRRRRHPRRARSAARGSGRRASAWRTARCRAPRSRLPVRARGHGVRGARRQALAERFDVVINATPWDETRSAGLAGRDLRARMRSPTTWCTPTSRRRSCAGRAERCGARHRRARHADRAGRGELSHLARRASQTRRRCSHAAAPRRTALDGRERAAFATWRWLGYALAGLVAFVVLVHAWYAVQILWWRVNPVGETSFMSHRLDELREKNPKAVLKYQWVPYERISTQPQARDDRRRGREVRRARGVRLGRHPAKALEKNEKRGPDRRRRLDDHAAAREEPVPDPGAELDAARARKR